MNVLKLLLAVSPIILGTSASAREGGKILKLQLLEGKDHASLSLKFENVTSKPIRIWSESCSWGYDALQLEAVYTHGQTTHFHRAPISWQKNFPQTWLVPAGGAHEIQLKLAESVWQGYPTEERPVKMRIAFSVPAGPDAHLQGAWVGMVKSNFIPTPRFISH